MRLGRRVLSAPRATGTKSAAGRSTRGADRRCREIWPGSPEDCGGTPGFEAFLEAIANPKHPEHEGVTEWHQGCYGKAFDPDAIDEREAKFRIAAIAKRRAAGKASQARKSR